MTLRKANVQDNEEFGKRHGGGVLSGAKENWEAVKFLFAKLRGQCSFLPPQPQTNNLYFQNTMPRVRQPESDEGRLFILNKAITVGVADRSAGRNYLDEALITDILALINDQTQPLPGIPGYATRIHLSTTARAKWLKETGEAQTAYETVELYLRDFLEVLKRRTVRLKHSASVLAFYKLPEDGSLPVLNNREDVETACKNVLDGEVEAVRAGFPAMVNPSAQELQNKLNDARREAGEITPVARGLEGAQRDVQALRPRAIELVEDVIAALRYNTRKFEPGAARDIMRSYGVAFDYDPGETPDPVPAPTPAPAPAPPSP